MHTIADAISPQSLIHEANEANEREKGMSLSTAFKIYPKAIMWSMILSSAIVMEGYDTAIVSEIARDCLRLY